MAVPKKKIPRSHRGNRRAHQALTPPRPQACPKCNEQKLSHRVCRHCGYYKSMKVLDIEE